MIWNNFSIIFGAADMHFTWINLQYFYEKWQLEV